MTRADPLLYEDRSGRRPPIRAESDLAKKPYIPRWQGRPAPASPLFTKPDGCCITDEWKPHVWEALTVLLQVDSWNGTDDAQFAAKRDVEELVHRLLTDKCCPPDGPPRRALPPGVTWDGQNLHICMEELDMPGDIYIYQGCCPDGTGGMLVGGDNTGADQGGGDVPLGSQATKCDIATYLLPYINSQALEWLQAVDTAITNGATAVDAIVGQTVSIFDPTEIGTTFIDNLAEILAISLDALIVAFEDVDMLLRVQGNWWGKSTATHYNTFTRSDLTRVGSSYPLIWGVVNTVSPRLFMEIFTRFADVNRVATHVLLARGQANTALCEYLAESNGEQYTPNQPADDNVNLEYFFQDGGKNYRAVQVKKDTQYGTGQFVDYGYFENVVGFAYAFSTLESPESCGVDVKAGALRNGPTISDAVVIHPANMSNRVVGSRYYYGAQSPSDDFNAIASFGATSVQYDESGPWSGNFALQGPCTGGAVFVVDEYWLVMEV